MNTATARQALFWTWAVAWTAMLLVPHPGQLPLIRHLLAASAGGGLGLPDKLIHAVGYFIFFVCGAAAFWRSNGLWRPRLLLTVGAVHGGVTEAIQYWIGSRRADPVDWLADLAGLLAGWMVCAALGLLYRSVAGRREPSGPGP